MTPEAQTPTPAAGMMRALGKWKLPWEKRGYKFVRPGTDQKILSVHFAWKTSAEAQAIIDLVQHRMNAHDDLLEALRSARALLADTSVSPDLKRAWRAALKRIDDVIKKSEIA